MWNGIEYGFDCPKCGADWPFENDAVDLPDDDEGEWVYRVKDQDEVLDAIYEFCDVLMHEQNIAVLDAVCRSWPIDDKKKDNLGQILGILTATLPVKPQLPSRDVLLKRAQLVYGNDGGLFDGL